jgi:hypothetical protein
MVRQWKKRFEERRKRTRIEDSNQYVTCRQFKFWRRMVIAGYVILTIGYIGNTTVDRERASDGRAALVQSGRYVSVVGCNRDFITIEKIRGVFQRAIIGLDEQFAAGEITKERHVRGIAFYLGELDRIRLPDCRDASNIITDNPFRPIEPPVEPLYPNGPGSTPPPPRTNPPGG